MMLPDLVSVSVTPGSYFFCGGGGPVGRGHDQRESPGVLNEIPSEKFVPENMARDKVRERAPSVILLPSRAGQADGFCRQFSSLTFLFLEHADYSSRINLAESRRVFAALRAVPFISMDSS